MPTWSSASRNTEYDESLGLWFLKPPDNCSVGRVIRHSIIENKIDIFLIEAEILDKLTDIITDPRNKVYLKSLSFAYVFIQLLVNNLPTHQFLGDIKVIGYVYFDTGFWKKKLAVIYSSSTLHTSIKFRERTCAIILSQKWDTISLRMGKRDWRWFREWSALV